MNIWAKMMTALRGGVNEAGEAIVDSQALRILDQEVRDASDELNRSKESLSAIIARQKLSQERASNIKAETEKHEGFAIQALEKGDDTLAQEIAQKIADLENQLAEEAGTGAGFEESATSLRAAIKQAERNIKYLKQQVDTVKAAENVQRAQAAVAERFSGSDSKLRTAMDSLERIKEKQALKKAQMNAANELSAELSETSLQAKLEEAGIAPAGKSADDVLERLRSRAGAS